MSLVARLAVVAVLLGGTIGAAVGGARAILPEAGRVAPGLRVAGLVAKEGSTPAELAEGAVARRLTRRVELRDGGALVTTATVGELGATMDAPALERRIAAVAHGGDLLERLDDALEARAGRRELATPLVVPVEPLAERLAAFKDEADRAARSARLDLAAKQASGGSPGRYLDAYATAAAIERALAEGNDATAIVAVVWQAVPPLASAEVVAAIDTSQVVSSFETRFGYLGGQASRAKNVARAAGQMEGVVLMPGEVVSFNDNVGPRSAENGFYPAPEIYKGEMREGIGGGTCQVAGTLHAAAYLGGFDVVERSNHSRPSGYIRIGLDATVVYPVVDLKLRNPFDFPVVVHHRIDKGTLRFELLGREHGVPVDFDTATVGVQPFKRKVEEVATLPAGKIIKKQRGIRGISIKKTRHIRRPEGERVEITTDVYPPTFEIFQVAPGTSPDDLPPAASDEPAAAAG